MSEQTILHPASNGESCDFCDNQEGLHYCLFWGVQIKNMDTVKCSKFEDKQNHKPTPSEAKRKHKSFDADIRYRNLLIGLSREITHLEKMQAQNEASGQMGSKPYAKAFGITAQRLRIVISTNGRAMNYYFGVKNPQDIYGQEIIKDNTDE